MRTKETFLVQSSGSHRTSTSLVLTLYSSAVTNLSFLKVKKKTLTESIAMFKALQYIWTRCIVDIRVLSRIYRLGEKSWVAEGHKLPRGSGGMPPGNLLKWIWTEIQCGAFCDTILGDVTVCALISSSLDDFSDIVPCMTVMITIFFLSGGREVGHFFGGGELLPLKYPRKNPEHQFQTFWNQLNRERFMNKSNV